MQLKVNVKSTTDNHRVRLLLIAPSYENVSKFGLPPYNIAYLLGFIKEMEEIDIQVVNNDAMSKEALLKVIETTPYDVLATGGMITLIPLFREMFEVSKQSNPNAWRILGGPIVAAGLDHIKDQIPFDVAVMGEGEVTFKDLLLLLHQKEKQRQLVSDKDLANIPGIVFLDDNGDTIITEARTPINFKEHPLKPAWEFFDVERYTKWNPLSWAMDLDRHTVQRQFSILVGRGCPFKCGFCGSPFGRKVRNFHIDDVIAEITELHREHNINVLYILNETLFDSRKRCFEFCEKLINTGMNIRIACNLRVDLVDEEVAAALKKAGCDHIIFGLESGTDEVLRRMYKGTSVEKNIRAMEIVRQAGIYPAGSIMYGYLDETIEQVRATTDMMLENDHVPSSVSIATAIPGTTLYNDALANGKIEDIDSYMKSLDGAICVADPPKANLSKIPDELFWKSLVQEYRRLMTGLYQRGKARQVIIDKTNSQCICPFCEANVEIRELNILNLDNKVMCGKCRRLIWIEVLKLPNLQEHGKRIDSFFSRIKSEKSTFAFVGDCSNTRWLLEVNVWGVDFEGFTGVYVPRGIEPYQTHAVSVSTIQQMLKHLPKNILIVQREYSDRIYNILMKGGFPQDRVMPLYPIS